MHCPRGCLMLFKTKDKGYHSAGIAIEKGLSVDSKQKHSNAKKKKKDKCVSNMWTKMIESRLHAPSPMH